MNLDQIEYIIDVAKTGSLSTSSENLYVSVSAISQAITNLEYELGFKIFERNRHGTMVTENGIVVIEKFSLIYEQISEVKEFCMIQSGKINGKLNIASIPGQMGHIIEILNSFKEDFPNVIVKIDEKPSNEIIDDIKKNKIDIAILNLESKYIEKENELNFEFLHQGKIQICVNKKNPLALKKQVEIEDLKDMSFVLYDGPMLKKFFDKYIRKSLNEKLLFTTNNVDSLRNAISCNYAITISTDYALKFEPGIINGEFIGIDLLNNNEAFKASLGWVYSTKKKPSYIAESFIKRLKIKYLQN